MMETIGFIGLGIMGRPMSKNLMKAGYRLVVRDHKRDPETELAGLGARVAASPRQAAEASDVVITMLPDTPQVVEVMRGPEGVFAGARSGTLVIDMSTISPVETRELSAAAEAQGLAYLDAPVSGGQVGAENATLSIMVGGEPAAFARARPIFEALGKNIVYIGEHGAGQVCKACNQIVVALTIEAVSEALVLAQKAGVDAAKVREALLGGFAQSKILDLHGKRILERNFRPGFRIRLHQKDLSIALITGKAYGAALPATALAAEMMSALVAHGHAEADHSALTLFVEMLANTHVGRST
jgi:2-hydroxy-3-oxopropionate reductase